LPLARGMKNTRFLDRRAFTAEAVLAALSGVVILVSESACGGGGASPTSPAPQPPAGGSASDEVGQISSNHGHSAVVTAAQLLAAQQVQLDIRGQADHTHLVRLSAADVLKITTGALVSTDSTTTNGHDHTVTFNPGSAQPGSGY
jgi:hypothetical protein